ncbi:MAG: nucleotidyltransferase domain-containing protein [Nannocystaceae bacterium]|nr:nucleotidyltransferase domain-containing protein [Nannocystaceae bacterium]
MQGATTSPSPRPESRRRRAGAVGTICGPRDEAAGARSRQGDARGTSFAPRRDRAWARVDRRGLLDSARVVAEVHVSAAERVALASLKRWLVGCFGDRLRELVLFGSRARGEGDEDSDVDVLVVIEGLTSIEAREIAYRCGDLLTEHDVVVSPFAVSVEHMTHLRSRERRIAAEIAPAQRRARRARVADAGARSLDQAVRPGSGPVCEA